MRSILFSLFAITALSFVLFAGHVQADELRPIILSYTERPSVINGTTLKYGPPYETVKLAGLAIPENEDAEAFLKAVLGVTKAYPLEIYKLENTKSRYSTPFSKVMPADLDYSLQQELIMMGLVWFFPYGLDTDDELIGELQAAEEFARINQRGLWADANSILAADQPTMMKVNNKMALVRGTIIETAVKDTQTFINFGEDYKTDFTIRIPADIWQKFPEHTRLLLETPSVNVLVRGFMGSYNGPSITVKHPAQIEILP